MKRTWTIIGVDDVPESFKWYQALFGQPASLLAHDYFGQILDSDGTVLLCLHEWGAHEHPSLMSPAHGTPGNGLLLFFRVDDFDPALQRAHSLVTRLEEEPHVNPNTQTLKARSSRSEIRTDTTLRSVRVSPPAESGFGSGNCPYP
jgi:catechol 2,3-dioxygenase-like lactoylglutathione lyase family enzyme